MLDNGDSLTIPGSACPVQYNSIIDSYVLSSFGWWTQQFLWYTMYIINEVIIPESDRQQHILSALLCLDNGTSSSPLRKKKTDSHRTGKWG